ncbi:MAG TPA: hypothetical protein VGC87_01625 [Pyrinomonadaceae bacterium]|jgi:hypothetical protein
MKQAKKLGALILLLVAILVMAYRSTSLGKDGGGGVTRLPQGNWTLTDTPYLESSYRANPVVVHSVTTEADKGLTVTKVGILSRSRNVSAVRLRWYLSMESNPEVILRQGETPEIQIRGGVPAGEVREIEYPVVTFAKLYQAEEVLNGSFVISVGVSAAKYDDGATWTESAKSRLDYMPPETEQGQTLERAHSSGNAPAPQQNCYTTCHWATTHYECWIFGGATSCTIVNGSCQVTYCGP